MRLEPIKPDTLPFARSYWVIPGKLLGGFYPGDRDPQVAESKLEHLLDCGITHFLSLMEAGEKDHAGRSFEDYRPRLLRLAARRGIRAGILHGPIQDVSVPQPRQMSGILDAMDAVMAAGDAVYVHCWGGRGRTGTVVGCWLARHGCRDAMAKLRGLTAARRELFGEVPETAEQRQFVRNWRAGQ